MRQLLLLAGFVLLLQQDLFSQYILNGSAQKNSCNCYTLTQSATFQSGSVWNSNKINLTQSFDFWFNVFLGCNDVGADGIVFILQPISTSVGTSGEGMGFGGVTPSIGIALDTYQNTNLNDPAEDHISIQANGVVNHTGDLAGPVAASASTNNIEDCQWHKLRISWDAGTQRLRAYFDGVLRVERQINLVSTIFNNDPNVYWGFTGATGGQVNLQQFCTALDPIFSSNFSNNIACEGQPVTFTNTSESFAPIASYHWNFGDGTTATGATPPPHTFPSPGNYTVTLKITGQDGCERDSSKTVRVVANPTAALQVADTCFGTLPQISATAAPAETTNQWMLDGSAIGGNSTPVLPALSAGTHQLQLTVASNFGCGNPAVAAADFVIKPLPQVNALVTDGCVNEQLNFEGQQTDAQTNISQWNWLVGGQARSDQRFRYAFATEGEYAVVLWAMADNGCASAPVEKKISIATAFVRASDTTIIRNRPTQLQVASNGTVLWSPAVGLSDPTSSTPLATLPGNQQYFITVTTPEGCQAADTMWVKVFNGPAIYVPTAFTPNGDGRNEILLPVYVGIKELKQFAVFNRWGQSVFRTRNMGQGWNGKAPAGTYVWLIEAVDELGQPLTLKGTVTIIR